MNQIVIKLNESRSRKESKKTYHADWSQTWMFGHFFRRHLFHQSLKTSEHKHN